VHHAGGGLYQAHRCDLGDHRLQWSARGPAGLAGRTGARGPAGPAGASGPAGLPGADGATGWPGPKGDTGPKGDPGAMVAGQAGGDQPISFPTGPNTGTLADTVLTTNNAGAMYVSGHVEANLECAAQTGFNCVLDLGLYVDGTPVPGSGEDLVILNATAPQKVFDLFGIAANVPAGVHHVTIGWDGDSPNPALLGAVGHTAAIGLDG
jgi:hypothetical protein